jgi:phage repressor protein C with HTH and peptisase S24 domain
MRHIGQMIKELRLRRGWTLRRLAQEVNKTPAYLSIIENKKAHINMPLLGDIARALGVGLSYFLSDEVPTGEGHSLRTSGAGESANILEELRVLVDKHTVSARPPGAAIRKIPVISYTAAGDPVSYESSYPVGFADEYVEVSSSLGDPHAFALRIKGDSMEPRFYDGDVVVVCPSWQVKENRPVVIKVNDDEVTCKVFSRAGESIILTSLNSKYPPRAYRQQDVVWVYPVVQVISNIY